MNSDTPADTTSDPIDYLSDTEANDFADPQDSNNKQQLSFDELFKYGLQHSLRRSKDTNKMEREELLSSSEHIRLRTNLKNAFNRLTKEWENLNLWDVLMAEYRSGVFKISECDSYFTKEELEMDDKQLMMNLAKEFVIENWNFLNMKDRDRYALLFRAAGMPLNFNPRKEELQLIHLAKKKELMCSKFRIEGDEYYYNFLPPNIQEVDSYKDYCLSIGSCSFYPIEQRADFPYEKYLDYLFRNAVEKTKVGIIFAPSQMTGQIGDQTFNTIESTWSHSFSSIEQTLDPIAVYPSLFKHNIVTPPKLLKVRYEQAAKINNIPSGHYCVLTFPQIQELSGFLMSMIDDQRPSVIKTFLNYVSITKKKCTFSSDAANGCDGCDRKLTIIIDCFHRIVIMKANGNHAEECYIKNKEKGYRVYQNIAVDNYHGGSETSQIITRKYAEQAAIIYELGPYLDSKKLDAWVIARNLKVAPTFEGINWGDYDICLREYEKALANDQIITKINNQYRLINIDKQSVISSFNYSDSSDHDGALIFSSKKCLEELANATWWSSDATFSMLKDDSIKFITVSIKKEEIGKKKGVFLCAMATLPGSESTANYTMFFKKLLELIKEHYSGDIKLKTIITDESRAEMAGISEAFDNKVKVINCVWHKTLNIEKKLDMNSAYGIINAMYSFSERHFLKIFVSVVKSCDDKYEELKKKLEKGGHTVSNRLMIKRYSNKKGRRNVSVCESIEESIEFYKKCIPYLNSLYITRGRWGLCYRIKPLNLKKKSKKDYQFEH